MNIGTRLILSAALAVGSTIGAAALGQQAVRDAQAEIAQAPAPTTTTSTTTTSAAAAATGTDIAAREAGVRSELLAAAEAGEISWAAAERVGEDLAGYIRGDRSAGTI
jgi:hypothetical protein